MALRNSTAREGLPCRLAAPTDLVLLKLEAGGPEDAYDILALLGNPGLEQAVAAELPQLSTDARAFWTKIQSLR
jgi:hypothetical protein